MFSRLLKSVVASVLVMSVTWAWALPTPKDIEAQVTAGHYAQAEKMLQEVLQDKPQSAKAHYELGQVLARQHRYKDAQAELQKAKDIDGSLKFAASPERFNTLFTKVSELAMTSSSSVVMEPSAVPGTYAAAKAAQEPATSGTGFSLSYVWVAIGVLVLLGLWLRHSMAAKSRIANYAPVATPMGAASAQRGFGGQFMPNAAPQSYPPQGYAQPNTGSTMTGAVVGGLAGVAAGYALSKALEGNHHSTSASSASESSVSSAGNNGYVPFDTPAQSDFGNFDTGSGSGWDNQDSDVSNDDSW